MRKISPRASSGFTIIEVLIVLAIAGMIMLIIFAAIPALYRSSRNNQRKQDAASVLAAVSHYSLNNSGAFAADCHDQANSTCYLFYTKKLAFYDPAAVTVGASAAVSVSNSNVDTVIVYNYRFCQPDGSATNAGAGYRDVVAVFGLEKQNGTSDSTCLQM